MAALEFMTEAWAEAVRGAVDAGPPPAIKATKLDKFWNWIDDAKGRLDCTLGLAVRGLPAERPDCLLLRIQHGRCTGARLVKRAQAEHEATYLLSGSLENWREILGGFDAGKTIMYRKLTLERGELLHFFRAAYYWTESLACIQRLPTAVA